MKKHVKLEYLKFCENTIYIVEGNKENFTISTSSLDKGWVQEGVEFLRLKDDGNGITVKIDNRKIRLNYHEVELLRLALGTNGGKLNVQEIKTQPYGGLE